MYRSEHPNPQFFRRSWINLNGEWEFEYDFGNSGYDRKLYNSEKFSGKINVPFCPESRLSGIGNTDFINCVWYRRFFELPNDWNAGHIFLNFGAVDYFSRIFINKQEVGTHSGGYTSFSFDITEYLCEGKNEIIVMAEDDNRKGIQPCGKQSRVFNSVGCDYTRTTGIWQTVWLEHTPENYIKSFKFYPDIDNEIIHFSCVVSGSGTLKFSTSYDDRPTGECTLKADNCEVFGEIKLTELKLWEIGNGRLYKAEFSFEGDVVESYFGMRDIKICGNKVLINGKSVFQRLVLDQGFYADGIYTAPSAEDLKRDILLSLDAGFNGARLHEKVFEPLFLYYCDQLGYIVWGEYPNWGIDHSNPVLLADYIAQWKEVVWRDFNHPSIVGWCPFNETWDYNRKPQWDPLISTIYHLTKSWDSTRPCIDTSGHYHTETDIYDVHDYSQRPDDLYEHYKNINSGSNFEGEYRNIAERQSYQEKKNYGKPFMVSEYGGICLKVDDREGWGYGTAPESEDEFIERYRGLTNVLLENQFVFGFCYTQLYDIEQETNGLYTYSREPKVDIKTIKEINSKKAAIED